MSIKGAWSVFWYVSRWQHLARMLFIIGCGLFLIGGGVFLLTRPYLPDEPDRVDINEAMRLIEGPSPRHIAFDAELDLSKKIYWTGGVPYWGNCPPDEVHPSPPFDAAESEFRSLVGCRVTVKGPINPGRTYRLAKDAGKDGQEKERLILAQVDGQKDRLWVISDVFKEGTAYENEWLSKTEFTGVLATYEQAMKALPAGFPKKTSFSALPTSSTFVILGDSRAFYDDKTIERFSSHYWVPVRESGGSIFVWVPESFEKGFDGPIAGVLEPRASSDYKTRNKGYADFSVVTGQNLPARYGVIRYRTAKEYNDAEVSIGWPFILFGSLIVGAGLLGLIVYILAPGLIFEAWRRAFEKVRGQGGKD